MISKRETMEGENRTLGDNVKNSRAGQNKLLGLVL